MHGWMHAWMHVTCTRSRRDACIRSEVDARGRAAEDACILGGEGGVLALGDEVRVPHALRRRHRVVPIELLQRLEVLLRVRHGWSASERATQLLLDGAARSDLPLEVLSVLQELRLHRPPEEAPRLAADLLHRCCRAGNVAAARALQG